nr:hypothetical protein [Tanacetum cinerariifolium]
TAAVTPPPSHHHPTVHATAATTAATAVAFPADVAAVAGCGRQHGRHRRDGAYKTFEFLFIFSMHGGLHRPYYGIFNLVVVWS